MGSEKFSLVKIDLLSQDILSKYQSKETHHSNYFWRLCALNWHAKLVHKVYAFYFPEKDEIYGFFSLRVDNFDIEGEHIPILDIGYLDFASVIANNEKSTGKILEIFIEKIEGIGIKISKIAGCRYIRAYSPYFPSREDKFLPGEPIIPIIDKVLKAKKFFDPKIEIKKKIRRIYPVDNKKSPLMIMRYYLRDLNFDSQET